jgi:hypothetical protein
MDLGHRPLDRHRPLNDLIADDASHEIIDQLARGGPGTPVRITISGKSKSTRVRRGTVSMPRLVSVDLAHLPCGVYPIVVRATGLRPALRIWSLKGGNTLDRFSFPGLSATLQAR